MMFSFQYTAGKNTVLVPRKDQITVEDNNCLQKSKFLVRSKSVLCYQ